MMRKFTKFEKFTAKKVGYFGQKLAEICRKIKFVPRANLVDKLWKRNSAESSKKVFNLSNESASPESGNGYGFRGVLRIKTLSPRTWS